MKNENDNNDDQNGPPPDSGEPLDKSEAGQPNDNDSGTEHAAPAEGKKPVRKSAKKAEGSAAAASATGARKLKIPKRIAATPTVGQLFAVTRERVRAESGIVITDAKFLEWYGDPKKLDAKVTAFLTVAAYDKPAAGN